VLLLVPLVLLAVVAAGGGSSAWAAAGVLELVAVRVGSGLHAPAGCASSAAAAGVLASKLPEADDPPDELLLLPSSSSVALWWPGVALASSINPSELTNAVAQLSMSSNSSADSGNEPGPADCCMVATPAAAQHALIVML
jgi:hypothetical protein